MPSTAGKKKNSSGGFMPGMKRSQTRRGTKGNIRTPAGLDPYRVYVQNLDSNCKRTDLIALFNGVGAVDKVTMKKLQGKDGFMRTSAWIKFSSPGVAKKAVTNIGGMEFQNRTIRVKQAQFSLGQTFLTNNNNIKMTKKQVVKLVGGKKKVDLRDVLKKKSGVFSRLGVRATKTAKPAAAKSNESSFVNLKAKFGETYGLKLEFLQKIGVDGPLMKTLRISKLPIKCTESEAGRLCSVGGYVQTIKVLLRQKFSVAFAVMSHPLESVQVISMLNGQVYKGQTLKVDLSYAEGESVGETGSYPMSFRLPQGLRKVGMGLGMNGSPISNLATGMKAMQPHPMVHPNPYVMPIKAPITMMGVSSGMYGGMDPIRDSFLCTSVQPERAPVRKFVEEPFNRSYVEEPIRRPYVEEPKRRPYVEEPIRRPYEEEPKRRPYIEEPNRRPYVEEPIRRPYVEEPIRRPYEEEPNRRPYMEEPNRRPYVEEPIRRTYVEEPIIRSYVEEALARPYIEDISFPLPTPRGNAGQFEVEIRNLPHDFRWDHILRLCQSFADPLQGRHLQTGVWRVNFDRENDALRVFKNIHRKVIRGKELQVILI